MNRIGLYTLFRKETLRFLRVATQTLGTPIVTALLYLLVFAYVMEEHVQVYEGVRYTVFLIPGLIMMSVIQNAFANTSSSIIQSKMTGNVTFMLLAPLSAGRSSSATSARRCCAVCWSGWACRWPACSWWR